jgi:hypothetical protein
VGNVIAKQDIPWGGVTAYTRGQRVEADAVKENGWEDLVVAEGSKEARQIHAEITGQPVDEADSKPTTSRAAAKTQEG